jgi:hypothetical protein
MRTAPRALALRALHLVVLWSFAVAPCSNAKI